MGQGIQDFYHTVQTKGLARDFQLRVSQLSELYFEDTDLVYARTAELPDRAITNSNVYFKGFKFNVPMMVNYPGSEGWTINFYCDQKYDIRDKLEEWSRSIFNEHTMTGTPFTPNLNNIIGLELINDRYEILRRYKLVGCYPTNIGSISYDLAGEGVPLQFDATFAYQYWQLVPLPEPEEPGLFARLSENARQVAEKAIRVGEAAQTVSNIGEAISRF